MRHTPPTQLIPSSLYKHFAAGTLAVAFLIALFASGEYRDARDAEPAAGLHESQLAPRQHRGTRSPGAAISAGHQIWGYDGGTAAGPGNDDQVASPLRQSQEQSPASNALLPPMPPANLPMSSGASVTLTGRPGTSQPPAQQGLAAD